MNLKEIVVFWEGWEDMVGRELNKNVSLRISKVFDWVNEKKIWNNIIV